MLVLKLELTKQNLCVVFKFCISHQPVNDRARSFVTLLQRVDELKSELGEIRQFQGLTALFNVLLPEMMQLEILNPPGDTFGLTTLSNAAYEYASKLNSKLTESYFNQWINPFDLTDGDTLPTFTLGHPFHIYSFIPNEYLVVFRVIKYVQEVFFTT